jgi:thiamine-phosphate pyrophosphorylase
VATPVSLLAGAGLSAWPRGFYAVLDRDDEALCRILAANASVVQVRLKPALTDEIVRVARMARRVCTELGVPLVVNDRIDIALEVGADGVHLGQSDLPLADARRIASPGSAGARSTPEGSAQLIGDRLAFGISTHDAQQVAAAIAERPTYLAYGPVYATRTKENPDPVQGIAALRAAVAAATAAGIPSVAIGGIRPDVLDDIVETGVSAVCAISAVNNAADVAAAARAIHNRFARLAERPA